MSIIKAALIGIIGLVSLFAVGKFLIPRDQGNSSTQAAVPASAITSSDSPIARDTTRVWFKGNLVAGADPATFVLMPAKNSSGTVYARDRYNVYSNAASASILTLIPGADPKTFMVP